MPGSTRSQPPITTQPRLVRANQRRASASRAAGHFAERAVAALGQYLLCGRRRAWAVRGSRRSGGVGVGRIRAGVRVSGHLYNNSEDVERFLVVLGELCKADA